MLFRELVETSGAVGSTRSRREKIGLLAALMRRLPVAEVAPAIAFLSGSPRQGRMGVGYAAVRDAAGQRRRHGRCGSRDLPAKQRAGTLTLPA